MQEKYNRYYSIYLVGGGDIMTVEEEIEKIVVLSNAAYYSSLGKYFIGQSNLITLGDCFFAWGALINPMESNVDIYLNAFRVTNFSDQIFNTEIWLGCQVFGKVKVSKDVAPGNQAILPVPKPKGEIQNANFVHHTPTTGSYISTRRIESGGMLLAEDFQGSIIIPPGSSVFLFFPSLGKIQIQLKVGFGWWEEEI